MTYNEFKYVMIRNPYKPFGILTEYLTTSEGLLEVRCVSKFVGPILPRTADDDGCWYFIHDYELRKLVGARFPGVHEIDYRPKIAGELI
jgi:hypothetical protein